jgi:hypothetical protein
MTKLQLDDIVDLRAYERERDEFRRHIIDLKKRRRIAVGPFVTFLFENRDTVRFQIQEMARAEKIITDEGIESELRVYNPLIPDPGQVSATLFIELTSDEQMREWFPKLVGIETMLEFVLADGDVVGCRVDPGHAAQLTRDEMTAAVHYVHWRFSPDQVETFGAGPVTLRVAHPDYSHSTELSSDSVAELLADLQG